jgi:hypothetical protein
MKVVQNERPGVEDISQSDHGFAISHLEQSL